MANTLGGMTMKEAVEKIGPGVMLQVFMDVQCRIYNWASLNGKTSELQKGVRIINVRNNFPDIDCFFPNVRDDLKEESQRTKDLREFFMKFREKYPESCPKKIPAPDLSGFNSPMPMV